MANILMEALRALNGKEAKLNEFKCKNIDEEVDFNDEEDLDESIGTDPLYDIFLKRLYSNKNDKEALEFDLNEIKTFKAFNSIPADEKEDLINKFELAISKLDEGDSVADSSLNLNSKEPNTPLLTLDELDKVDVIVDESDGWYSVDTKPIMVKARRLVRNGYSLVDYSFRFRKQEVRPNATLDDIAKYSLNAYQINNPSGYRHEEQYSYIKEYVDRKNKIYYFCFGPQQSTPFN